MILLKLLLKLTTQNLFQNLNEINDEEREYGFFRGTEEILASFESNSVIEQLISYAVDKSQSNIIRRCCAEALSISKGKVDISVFERLVEDDDLFVRRNAISGLRRYPNLQVEEILFSHINDDNCWIQHDIIEILGEKGLLVELIKNDLFPNKYYDVTISAYLNQIRKYQIYELSYTVDKLEYDISDITLQMHIVETYCSLYHESKAKKIIEHFYDGDNFVSEGYILYYIIKLAPRFNSQYAIELIQRALKTINTLEKEAISTYGNLCAEALGKIGGDDSVELLKKMAEKSGSEERGILIESVFRSLNSLVSTIDEDWYISFLESNTHLGDIDLHRVIEGLGGIGTEKSTRTIREIAQSYKDNGFILNICFRSYENIMFSSGKITDVQEKDLLLQSASN